MYFLFFLKLILNTSIFKSLYLIYSIFNIYSYSLIFAINKLFIQSSIKNFYSSKLSTKPNYNSVEVYSKTLESLQTTEEHDSNLASTSVPSSLDSASQSLSENVSSHSQSRTVLKPDLPIGRKAPKSEKSNLWHGRLGHPGKDKLKFCARCSLYRKRGLDLEPREVDYSFVCEPCREASAHASMSHKELDKDKFLTGQCWHADATGRKETPALKTGTLIGILFRDRQSRYYAGYSVKNNDADEILHVIEKWDSEELLYWRKI